MLFTLIECHAIVLYSESDLFNPSSLPASFWDRNCFILMALYLSAVSSNTDSSIIALLEMYFFFLSQVCPRKIQSALVLS